MNYNEYAKLFTLMQQDHFKLNEMVSNVKIVKLQEFFSIENEQSAYVMEEYNKLKVKILATANRLKEYFVENNEEFSYPMFKVSLDFFNSYSMQENIAIMQKSDYKKINKVFLEEYKQGLVSNLTLKQTQYDKLANELKRTEEMYEAELGEPLKFSEKNDSRAKTLKAKFNKDYTQSEVIYKKVHFMQKEVDLINDVLENNNEQVR